MDARFVSVRGVCLLLMLLIGVAVFRVSSAPVSTKEVVGGKDETVVKNNELNVKEKAVSANTESASYSQKSSSNATQPEVSVKRSLASSRIESAPVNTAPVRSSPVRINPVPGQMERVLSASSQMRKGSQPDASEGSRMSDEDNEFLEDMGVEEEEEDKTPAAAAAAAELETPENQQWRELLTDQRIQDLMANRYNQDQQQDFGDSFPSASSSSSSSQSLDSRALTDYLVRTGEIDRTLHDLVVAGVMTSEEATLYREAINLEYGASPQSTNNDQVVVDPEVIYDDGQPSEVLYDGPNYIQPFPVDYQLPVGEYLNLAPQSLQQQQQNQDEAENEEEEQRESMGRSDGDYGQSAGSRFKDDEEEEQQQEEATNELLRDLLGTIALQEEDGEGLSYKSPLPSEMEVQRPNLPSSTNQWSPVGKEVDDDRGTDVEKELEALPTTGERIETDGSLEEEQLEEMRNRVRPEKTKQDNRTKPLKNRH